MKRKSFTLIELLVVIAIIGLLSSIILVSMSWTRGKARDMKRLQDMKTIVSALELYYDKNDEYPGQTSSYGEHEPTCGGWDTSNKDNDSDGRPFIEPLIDEGIVSAVPLDPINNGICVGKTYKYYRYFAGLYGCDAERGAYFVLGIVDMESSGNPYKDSPGWSCSGRDWQDEFDWVIGGFTH
jgi:prepilin-type N-terminal cleavage/methylation domain-containing protein